MEKQEILAKAQSKKAVVGEMEREKLGKGAIISLVVAGIVAVAFTIIEGIFGHFTAIYAIATICFTWAGTFYTLQYFYAKRPWQVLIGSVLEYAAAIFFIVRYVLALTGIWW